MLAGCAQPLTFGVVFLPQSPPVVEPGGGRAEGELSAVTFSVDPVKVELTVREQQGPSLDVGDFRNSTAGFNRTFFRIMMGVVPE
jgi:hypothetical protein